MGEVAEFFLSRETPLGKAKLFLLFSIFAIAAGAVPRSFDEIKRSHELRICYTPWRGADTAAEFPSPYLEIAKEFAKDLKLAPKVTSFPWDEQFKDEDGKVREGKTYAPRLFTEGKCDLIANNL